MLEKKKKEIREYDFLRKITFTINRCQRVGRSQQLLLLIMLCHLVNTFDDAPAMSK